MAITGYSLLAEAAASPKREVRGRGQFAELFCRPFNVLHSCLSSSTRKTIISTPSLFTYHGSLNPRFSESRRNIPLRAQGLPTRDGQTRHSLLLSFSHPSQL